MCLKNVLRVTKQPARTTASSRGEACVRLCGFHTRSRRARAIPLVHSGNCCIFSSGLDIAKASENPARVQRCGCSATVSAVYLYRCRNRTSWVIDDAHDYDNDCKRSRDFCSKALVGLFLSGNCLESLALPRDGSESLRALDRTPQSSLPPQPRKRYGRHCLTWVRASSVEQTKRNR
jgi:hypothetical protein